MKLKTSNPTDTERAKQEDLMKEVFKIVNSIAQPIINSLFQFRCNTNNIRDFQEIYTENRKTVRYGMETVTYRDRFSGRIYRQNIKTLSPLMDLNQK